MLEHHVEVTRTARYWTLGPDAGPVRLVWFACHGYGQLAGRFLRRFEPLDRAGRRIIAPEALNRYYLDDTGGSHGPDSRVGATWMTREDRLAEIDDYVRYLDSLHAHILGAGRPARPQPERPTVCALGFSQGGATASRWAAMGRARIDHLVLWASALPPDLDIAAAHDRLATMQIWLVAGRQDEWAGPAVAQDQLRRLRDHGLDARVILHDGGHRVETAPLLELASAIDAS